MKPEDLSGKVSETAFTVPEKCDGVEIVATPIGGTFTLSYRHGRSDPIPFDATVEQIEVAGGLADRRDADITLEHAADPEAFMACAVCNPPVYVPPAPRSRWQRFKDRVSRTWWEWRADY